MRPFLPFAPSAVAVSALCVSLCCGPQASAAMLRPYTQIASATVRLSDLFAELGATADRDLGAAPAPGARIVIGSPQLAAIARDFGVDWRPSSGGEQAIVERRAEMLHPSEIVAALREALRAGGAPQDFDLATPDLQPVPIPVGSAAAPAIDQLNYDAQTSRFTARVEIAIAGEAGVQMRVSGQVIAMTQALVATHRLAPGSQLAKGDLRPARVRLSSLRATPSIAEQDALGQLLRHDLAEGQVLTVADLAHASLVERGSLVRMSLDSDGLSLSAQGVARESGGRGDHIRVENPLSHLMVVAEVTGPGEVRVAPREAVVTLVSAQ
jgi:flagella basal body P-ring formation protein FlgA